MREVEWIYLAQWRTHVNVVMTILGPLKKENFFIV